MSINRKKFKKALTNLTGCAAQYDGWPCGTCFSVLRHDLELEEDIGNYWQAVLDYRGDYDGFEWQPEDTDPLTFPTLIREFYNKITQEVEDEQ